MESVVTTKINSGITLDEYKGGMRFGTDTLLLAHFCGKNRGKAGCDLGSGNGALSLLLLANSKAARMTGVELIREYAELSVVNAEKNGFADKFVCVNRGVEDVTGIIGAGSMDFVATNPPYLKSACGKINTNPLKYAAFHETTADIDKFCACAGYILKSGGRFYCVYRPEYIAKLIAAMDRNGIKLKKLRYVYPSAGKPPCLILTEGKKGGSDGTVNVPPLYIYADGSHTKYSAETDGIYDELA